MKKLLVNNFKFLINIIYLCKLIICIKLRKAKKIYFVDIDNTLSDTWPTLKIKNYNSENKRLKSLPIFIGMKRYLSNSIINDKHLLVFLSA